MALDFSEIKQLFRKFGLEGFAYQFLLEFLEFGLVTRLGISVFISHWFFNTSQRLHFFLFIYLINRLSCDMSRNTRSLEVNRILDWFSVYDRARNILSLSIWSISLDLLLSWQWDWRNVPHSPSSWNPIFGWTVETRACELLPRQASPLFALIA